MSSPEHASSSGGTLPQFDPTYYGSQIFWLAVVFAGLYYVVSKIALPRASAVLETREERIAADIRKAKELQREAGYIDAKFRVDQAKAHADAKALLEETKAEVDAEIRVQQQQLNAELSQQCLRAEESIASLKQAAIDDLEAIVSEVSTVAYKKLTGEAPESAIIESAVKSTVSNTSL